MNLVSHLASYIVDFARNPVYAGLTILALTLAGISLWQAAKGTAKVTRRVTFLYLHLALLLTPVFLLSYSVGCSVPAIDCSAKTLIYSVPLILGGIVAVATALGFFLVPILYARALGARKVKLPSRMERIAREHGIRQPTLHIIPANKPFAFTFATRIFLSTSMLEKLTPRELDAVLLHELAHVQRRSSWLKASSIVAKLTTPLARFADWKEALDNEERAADAFAASIHGTTRYLEAARKKTGGQ